MMKRRIFPWMGLIVLFLLFGHSQDILAKDHYKVKPGDTLAKISRKTGVSIQALKAANNLSSNSLKAHRLLVIPKAGGKALAKSRKAPRVKPAAYYVVKRGDNLPRIARRCHVSANALKRMNHLRSSALKVGQKLIVTGVPAKAPMVRAAANPATDGGMSEEESEEEVSDKTQGDTLAETEIAEQDNSCLLGTWKNPGERELFVRVVMGFLGAPYRFGGSTVRGLDCSAFVKNIYELFDINLPRTAHEQSRVGVCVTRDRLEEGDLVFFNTRRALGHVGIYIGNNEFVHASSRDRTVKVDSLASDYYSERFVKAVRVKGLDGGT